MFYVMMYFVRKLNKLAHENERRISVNRIEIKIIHRRFKKLYDRITGKL